MIRGPRTPLHRSIQKLRLYGGCFEDHTGMRHSGAKQAVFLSLLIIIMDASAGASILTEDLSTQDDQCASSDCNPDFFSSFEMPVDASEPVEEPGWWLSYGYDHNSDGMDDRLESIINGSSESISPTSVLAPDGRMTVAIVVNYAWHPGNSDTEALKSTLRGHGWISEGSFFFNVDILDSILVDRVPVSALNDVLSLDGVVLIEQQNVLEPYLDIATKASKVRVSDVYPQSFWSNGYMGDGVVIAILDTGVDNEHFSLDDFSDANQDNENAPSDLNDPKWVAGCDATSSNQVECSDGNFDPDDGDGHGTHVAGIALGTGDSDRENIGYSPGSYLVDVKVLNDIGTTNSGATIKGINWVANNVDTDWGNNESSRGIDVMSMSFGSINSPGGDGQGDDGQNADARAVNAAVDAGVVAVAAIGNDGQNRVTSVGAADKAITVGSIDDDNSINREDDSIASYSNYGPRTDDGDNDFQDELKPDVVGPGSGIISAEYAPLNPLPVGDQPRASDGYTSKDGTSMACPAVAGLAALLLSYDGDLTPEDVKNIIKETAEQRGDASAPSIDDRWNNQYGYGIVDGEAAFRCVIGGECTQITGGAEWVHVQSPSRGDWLVQGRNYSFSGILNESDPGTFGIQAVEISAELSYKKQKPNGKIESIKSVLVNTTNVTLVEGRWSTIVPIPEIDVNDYYGADVKLKATATNESGRRSQTNVSLHPIGFLDIGISEPEQDSTASGSMAVRGSYSTVDGGVIRWKIDDGSWVDGPTLSDQNLNRSGYTGEFQFSIDSEEYEEGEHDLFLQIVSGDGFLSEVGRRTIDIDNYPPRPNLILMDSVQVTDYGIPISESRVGSYLEVRGEVRNEGDIGANDILVSLYENGQRRFETSIEKISVGEQVPFILYWSPSIPGTKDVKVVIDHLNSIEELDESDNTISLDFEIIPLADGVDIDVLDGGVFTTPSIPTPSDQFILSTMIKNQGSEDAASIEVTFYSMEEGGIGWLPVASRSLSMLPSGQAVIIEFPVPGNGPGVMNYRFTASGPELADEDWSNNELEGSIVIEDSQVNSRPARIAQPETPLAVMSFRETGVILASEGTQIIVYKIQEDGETVRCSTPLERFWSGSISTTVDDGGLAHVVWTRRLVTGTGVLSETVSYATIDDQCSSTVPQDLMNPLPMNLGDYFGVDLDEDDGRIIIAGYLRDIASGSLFEPTESIFILEGNEPQSASEWSLTENVIQGIDTMSQSEAPIEVEIGDELVHLIYMSSRNDTSSVPVLGLWYAHGLEGAGSWNYKRAIAVQGSSPSMAVTNVEGDDRVSIVWFEGEPDKSTLNAMIVDESFNIINGASVSIMARGGEYAKISQRGDILFLTYDHVTPVGRVVSLGVIDPNEGWIGIGNRVSTGSAFAASAASDGLVFPFMVRTTSGDWVSIEISSNGNLDDGPSNIFESARMALGLNENEFNLLLMGLATALLMILVSLLIGTVRQGLSNMRDKRRSASVVIETDPEDALDIDQDEVEEVSPTLISPTLEGAFTAEPLPPPPLDPSDPYRTVICDACGTRFELLRKIMKTTCPSCGERVEDFR